MLVYFCQELSSGEDVGFNKRTFDNTNKQFTRDAIMFCLKNFFKKKERIKLLTLSSDCFSLKDSKLVENQVLKRNRYNKIVSYEYDIKRFLVLKNKVKNHKRFKAVCGNINYASLIGINAVWLDYCGPITESSLDMFMKITTKSHVKFCAVTIGARNPNGLSLKEQLEYFHKFFNYKWKPVLMMPYKNGICRMYLIAFERIK